MSEQPGYNLVPCAEHELLACHVNKNGRHVDPRRCCCETVGRGATYCPIDLHNPLLYVGQQLGTRPLADVVADIRAEQRAARGLADQGELFA